VGQWQWKLWWKTQNIPVRLYNRDLVQEQNICTSCKHVCTSKLLFRQQQLQFWHQRPYCAFSLCLVSSDPPTITGEGYTIDVCEGDLALIPCPVLGNPDPSIFWYNGNETSPSTMINTNNILRFCETVLDDSGWYTCFAENSLGNVTVTVQLRVGRLYRFVWWISYFTRLITSVIIANIAIWGSHGTHS